MAAKVAQLKMQNEEMDSLGHLSALNSGTTTTAYGTKRFQIKSDE